MSPYSTLLSACSQCCVVIEQWDGRAAEGDVMVSVAAIGIDGGKIPDGDGELGIGGDGVVVEGKRQPLIPDACSLEVLVGCLSVDGQGLGVGEGLDGDVKFGVRAEIAAAVAEIGSSKEGGVWNGLLVSFKSVPLRLSVWGALWEWGRWERTL